MARRIAGVAGLVVLLLAMLASVAGLAADGPSWRKAGVAAGVLNTPIERGPLFPEATRARAVLSDGVCWKTCQSYCTGGLDLCLRHSPDQAYCVASTDACSRSCQTRCRSRGGPLIAPIPQ